MSSPINSPKVGTIGSPVKSSDFITEEDVSENGEEQFQFDEVPSQENSCFLCHPKKLNNMKTKHNLQKKINTPEGLKKYNRNLNIF